MEFGNDAHPTLRAARRQLASEASLTLAQMIYLDDSAICAQNLSVDPAPIGAGKKRDHGRDVSRLRQAFQRRKLNQVVDNLLRLAFQKQIGGCWTGCNGVDGDVATAQFVGQDVSHGLNATLRGCIDSIGRLIESDNTG
jgi:hypothetical protein